MTPTTPPGLLREADRVADRLRVLGPRWTARRRPEDAEALARVRVDLQALEDLAASGRGEPPRLVPELGPHALADQFLVLAHEAALAGASAPAQKVLEGLRRAL